MARHGTLDHGFDDDRGGNAGLANIDGYYFNWGASRDPVIGRALGGAGGGPNASGIGTGGACGSSTSGGAGGGSSSYESYSRCTCAGGHFGAGGYSGAGAVSVGSTGKRGTRNSQESETESYGEPEHAAVHVIHTSALD